MDHQNFKGSYCFRFKFALKHFVKLEDFVTNLVVKIQSWYNFFGMEQRTKCHWPIAICMQEWCANICIEMNVEKHISREHKSSRNDFTANISDSNESQSNNFFKPELRHCLLIQARFESCDFQIIVPDNLQKTCIRSDIQKIFETFYLQFQILIFLSDNIQDFNLFYLVLESLWKLFTSNIKNHTDLIFFHFFILKIS